MLKNSLFHVFRNTPFGRDTLMQSAYFTRKLSIPLTLYIPTRIQFLMKFPKKKVTVNLDRAFLRDPRTAMEHADGVLREQDIYPEIFEPSSFEALDLPDIPTTFGYLCSPRSISGLSTKIGMGYIGPKVRKIVQYSTFPVLMPTPVYKEWNRIVAFFGGSKDSVEAVKVAVATKRTSGLPLQLFTKAEEKKPQGYYEGLLEKAGLLETIRRETDEWLFYSKGHFKSLLFDVPSDALAVVGAYGHRGIKEILFGSKMESIQSVLPNNMLIVGPNCIRPKQDDSASA